MSVYWNRRMLTVLLLGFSSGFPFALTGSTLQAWLTDAKVDIKTIGLLGMVAVPYAFKFAWAPLMDRFVPPFLGRRRGWAIVTQLGLIAGLVGMSLCDPTVSALHIAYLALVVAFFSASQDIVIDAYRTDIVTSGAEVGPGAAFYTSGYRVAMLASGAGALALADHMSWQQVYLVMAGAMLVGVIATLSAPEPKIPPSAPKTLRDAIVNPLMEFFKRPAAWEILLFLFLYKIDVFLATALQTTFLKQTGFTNTEIAYVSKGLGFAAALLGTLVGGTFMVKLGLRRALWSFGIFQGVAGLSFALLASLGRNYPAMAGAITAENFCAGLGTAAYSAFMMSICDKRFTATQYALFTGFMALARSLAVAPSGYIQESVGWTTYFIIATVIMVPGLLMLTRYSRWGLPSDR
jgi:PAT family beta-lactamase induction signal transducer AmpG